MYDGTLRHVVTIVGRIHAEFSCSEEQWSLKLLDQAENVDTRRGKTSFAPDDLDSK